MGDSEAFNAKYPLDRVDAPSSAISFELSRELYQAGIDATIQFMYDGGHYVSGCVLAKTGKLGDQLSHYEYFPSLDRTKPTAIVRQVFLGHGEAGKVVVDISVR
jgi:hypothetical protein